MIPVSEPLLEATDLEYVAECVRSGWVSSAGRYITEFEEKWAAYCGRRQGVATANGTVALELAMASLDLEPGSEVIMPSFTIISCALAIVRQGGVPVLVDADPETWCLDVDQVAAKITPRTRAIMPVHIYGHPADMDPLIDLADKHGLFVIEDAAEAHGAEYHARRGGSAAWRRCGGFGTLSCFSFYANKPVTTGEGGMVLTDDSTLAERLRSLRNLCFDNDRRFVHEELGFNFRLTNMQAALGLAQVERIDRIVERKRRIGRLYTERLKDVEGLQIPVERTWARNIYWVYGVVLADNVGFDAATFAAGLRQRDIQTRPFFMGMHEQPALQARGLFGGERYPVTERIARRGVYLPSGLTLEEPQIDRVCEAVREVLS